jgi:hypothetical protein
MPFQALDNHRSIVLVEFAVIRRLPLLTVSGRAQEPSDEAGR